MKSLRRPGWNWRAETRGHSACLADLNAFARRYPFMLGEMEQRDPVACIDEKFDGLQEKTGARLFADDGADTPFLQERVKLINEYFAAAKRTDPLLRTLDDLQLLRPVTIESKLDLGSSAILHGFLTVDEAKLNALSDEDFLRLRKEGLLSAIYAHLFSLSSIERLRKPIAAAAAAGSKQADEQEPGPPKRARQLQ